MSTDTIPHLNSTEESGKGLRHITSHDVAKRAGVSQSAVSRQISALEEEISTPLFQRHARGLTLTDEGELLFTAVTDVLGRLAAAEAAQVPPAN